MTNDADAPDTDGLPETERLEDHSDEGDTVGPYRLQQKIGEGGMGEVWLAEQHEPVRRKVALKVIKQGMDTKQVVARFEAERQALAVMDHPTVAKVFDGGTTPRGRPYFVMEYVNGVPITEYCDRHRLTIRERIELFRSVCEGVQHAHQKAIIHRDLKPSNILVAEQDGRPAPKIIDFGVAKATAQRLTERTMFTELGTLIGTPEYMSPEQAELTGEDVDTRTDVYSLGVILYELLVGALPFDSKTLRSGGYEGIRRVIREETPKRPSTRFITLGDRSAESAKNHRVDRAAMLRELRGDLDWITMKALEKDRARRYGSPMELAADLGRRQNDEPVQARPPAASYRARKFIRRHRLGVTAAGVVTLALVAGVFGTTLGLVRARRAEVLARAEQKRADSVAAFLSGMLKHVDPISMGRGLKTELLAELARQGDGHVRGDSIEAVNTVDVARHLLDKEFLDKAVKRIDSDLGDQPLLAGTLSHTIGSAYFQLQLYGPAEAVLTRAAALLERTRGPADEQTLDVKGDLADVFRRTGRYRQAEAIYKDSFETLRRTRGDGAPEALYAMNMLGDAYRSEGRDTEAEPLLREALAYGKRSLGPTHRDTLWMQNNLALVLRDQGEYAEAEALLRDTIEKMQATFGIDDQEALNSTSNLGSVLTLAGRPAEAAAILGEAVPKSQRILGDEVYLTIMMRKRLGDAYLAQHRLDEAEPLMRGNLVAMQRTLGADHPETFGQMHALGRVLAERGRAADALPLLSGALAGFRRTVGDAHFRTLAAANDLAAADERLGRRAEAEQLYLATARARGETRERSRDPAIADAAFHLARFAAARGDRSQALSWLRASIDFGFTEIARVSGDPDLARLRGPELDAALAMGPTRVARAKN